VKLATQTRSVSTDQGGSSGTDETNQFSHDAVLKVLSNQRRRFVLHFLKRRGRRSVEVADLAGQIAGWENEKPPDLLSYKERKRVQNALHQFHLPKLDDHGLIEYDSQRKTVTLTDAAADQDFYIDVVPKRDIPWSLYYLGYALLSGLVLVGGWAEVWPVTLLETELWGVFFVTIILFSSLVHVHDSKRNMRLGARETPPEVK
jgi:hypothetical protein